MVAWHSKSAIKRSQEGAQIENLDQFRGEELHRRARAKPWGRSNITERFEGGEGGAECSYGLCPCCVSLPFTRGAIMLSVGRRFASLA